MGLYQLVYMDSVPAYAAVNETVSLARRFVHGKDKFINGVLRGYLKNKEEISLPDSEKDPVKYLSVAYSVNEWIVKIWLDTYGRTQTEEILKAVNKTPKLSVRVNLMKTDAETLAGELQSEGFCVEISGKTDRGLFVSGSRLLESNAYKQGLFSVQDIASVMASDILECKTGRYSHRCLCGSGRQDDCNGGKNEKPRKNPCHGFLRA